MVIFNHHLIFWKSLAFPYSIYSRMTMYIYIVIYIYHDYHSRLTSSNGQDEIHQLLHIYIYTYIHIYGRYGYYVGLHGYTDKYWWLWWARLTWKWHSFPELFEGTFCWVSPILVARKTYDFLQTFLKTTPWISCFTWFWCVFCKSPRRESSVATVAIGQVSQWIRLSSGC